MVGGVHGSGKSSICESLSQNLPFVTCVSASKLIEHIGSHKYVVDVMSNQKLLIDRIQQIRENNDLTIVDGHFCVIDKNGQIRYVGQEIFKRLRPSLIVLVQANSDTILQRIAQRDKIKYTLDFIEEMKLNETYWAIYTSKELDIPLYEING